jgi:hypothetical protein
MQLIQRQMQRWSFMTILYISVRYVMNTVDMLC